MRLVRDDLMTSLVHTKVRLAQTDYTNLELQVRAFDQYGFASLAGQLWLITEPHQRPSMRLTMTCNVVLRTSSFRITHAHYVRT